MQTIKMNKESISWDLLFVVANKNDAINNSSVLWEGVHKTFNAGQLTITSVSTEAQGQCDTINFDPLVLSDGFEPSGAPMLPARKKPMLSRKKVACPIKSNFNDIGFIIAAYKLDSGE